MRVWHKDLISVLPRQQLLGQWRECCAIAKNLSQHGTPNHILVNRIIEYPIGHFMKYSRMVFCEMIDRGYNCKFMKFAQHCANVLDGWRLPTGELFPGWHNDRYLRQCLYNLQEKYDCNGISNEEWLNITDKYGGMI